MKSLILPVLVIIVIAVAITTAGCTTGSASYQDDEFLDSFEISFEERTIDINTMTNDISGLQLTEAENSATQLSMGAKNDYNLLKQYNLSPDLEPVQTNYLLSLEALEKTGDYTSKGVSALKDEEYELSMEYLDLADLKINSNS